MHESKLLKDIQNCANNCKGISNNFFDSKTELVKSMQEWMVTQHNCAIRGISPYLTELLMENTQCRSSVDNDALSTLNIVIDGLINDEQEVQCVKNSVIDLQYQINGAPPASQELENKLTEKTFELNNIFIAKEVKKIIRFKFGMANLLDNQIESTENSLKLLKAQRQLLQLLPEAYEKETFRKSKVNVANEARQIVSQYHVEKQQQQCSNKKQPSHKRPGAKSKIPSKNTAMSKFEENIETSSDDSFIPSPQAGRRSGKMCACHGNLCDRQQSLSLDSLSDPSFLYNSHDSSDGSKYFLSELAKNCSVVARQVSESILDSNSAMLKTGDETNANRQTPISYPSDLGHSTNNNNDTTTISFG